MRPMNQMGKALAVPAIVSGVVFAVVFWASRFEPSQLTIRVDLDAGGGAIAELFLNRAAEPLRVAVSPGRRVYEFRTAPTVVTGLRLDPTDAAGSEIVVYGIDIVGTDGATLRRIAPAEIGTWILRGATVVSSGADRVQLRSVDADPMLIGTIEATGVEAPASVRAAIAGRLQRDPWLLFALVLPLFSLFEIKPARPWLIRMLVGCVVVALWPVIYGAVAAIDWGPTPSSVAVSRAAFLGLSLPALQMGVVAAFAAMCVIGLLIAFWKTPRPPGFDQPERPSARVLALIAAGCALVTVPDLAGTASWLGSVTYQPHWDYDNILYWSFWTAHDALPMRDFWYPYGGLFLFDLSWPAGPLLSWAADAGRYAVFTGALALASGRVWSSVAATAALMVAENLGMNLAAHRYGLAVNVVLAYVAADRFVFRARLPLATLAVALGMALVLEPAQLVYAAPAVVVIAALRAFQRREFRDAVRGLATTGVMLVAGGIPLVLCYWILGMLPEMAAYYWRIGDAAQYATLPGIVTPSPWPDFPAGSVVVWFPALVFALGVSEFRRVDPRSHTRAMVLAGLALVGFMVLQKHLVRPMPDTLLMFGLIAGIAFVVLSPAPRIPANRIGLAAGIGLFAAILISQDRLATGRTSVFQSPSRLLSTVGVLFSADTLAQVNRDRFAPERFALYRSQRELVEHLERRRGGAIRLFALSDDPILYVLSTQPPFWMANHYNGSPIYEQRKTIAALTASPPDYVVAQKARLSFDEVQVAVRTPDVIAFLIEHFVADEPAPPYTVLRPRTPADAVVWGTWRELLGETVDLGRLPAQWASDVREPCGTGTVCDEWLLVIPEQPSAETSARVYLAAGEARAIIRIRLREGQDRYAIPLSRLWPAVAARAIGVKLDVSVDAGFRLERATSVRSHDRVY